MYFAEPEGGLKLSRASTPDVVQHDWHIHDRVQVLFQQPSVPINLPRLDVARLERGTSDPLAAPDQISFDVRFPLAGAAELRERRSPC